MAMLPGFQPPTNQSQFGVLPNTPQGLPPQPGIPALPPELQQFAQQAQQPVPPQQIQGYAPPTQDFGLPGTMPPNPAGVDQLGHAPLGQPNYFPPEPQPAIQPPPLQAQAPSSLFPPNPGFDGAPPPLQQPMPQPGFQMPPTGALPEPQKTAKQLADDIMGMTDINQVYAYSSDTRKTVQAAVQKRISELSQQPVPGYETPPSMQQVPELQTVEVNKQEIIRAVLNNFTVRELVAGLLAGVQ